MRIAYVCADSGIPVLGHKGASVHVRAFTDALVELGHEVCIVGAAGSGRDSSAPAVTPRATFEEIGPMPDREAPIRQFAAALLRLGLPRDPINLRSELRHVLADPDFVARALPALQAFEPDLLIARHALFSVAGSELARALGCPHVLEVNAPLTEERRRHWGLTLAEGAESAERLAFAGADAIVAVSEGVRGYVLRSGAPPDRVTVLPNGVDLKLIHPGIDPTPVRRAHGLEDKTIAGFVGSLKPWHGVDLLLDAFADLRDSPSPTGPLRHRRSAFASLHLLIVGDGPERMSLHRKADALGLTGQVTFTGVVGHDAIPGYLAAIDVAVAPYRATDDFYFSPLKVIEYMAAGRPVVAPSLGQIPALLTEAGAPAGLLYPPDDLAELGAALLALASNPDLCRTLGLRGAASTRQNHSWTSVATAVLGLVRHPRSAASCPGISVSS